MVDLLALVDAGDFSRLFLEELCWERPKGVRSFVYEGDQQYLLRRVSEFRGLAVWVCDSLPEVSAQRQIDAALSKECSERLVIFCGAGVQEWRWPRRGRMGSVASKLMLHRHFVGEADPALLERLEAMVIGVDEDVSLPELLTRMRAVFDVESESASQRAARLMGSLYEALNRSQMSGDQSTQLLARLLFLWFGDDAGMWRRDTFQDWLAEHTAAANLHVKLNDLFDVVNDPRADHALDSKPWVLAPEFQSFRYINGGLFAQRLDIPPLSEGFRDGVLEACRFDWSVINPAIFGSMFQTVKDSKARRAMGEHYTTETNILRTLRPLFLDELEQRFERAWDSKAELTKLHNHLGQIRVLDPACGCGNFLIVAYRELRALEHQIIARRRELDLLDGTVREENHQRFQMDGFQDTKILMSHFAGIEIEEWPAAIASTAMLLVDHQANQEMSELLGQAMVRLPIDKMNRANIVHANALRTDWHDVIEATPATFIVGNPPFIGQYSKSAEQTEDAKLVWGADYDGYLDYVTCWFKKSADFFKDTNGGRFAFVSTNSIAQGQPVPALFRPLFRDGWRIRFAHQTFPWTTEATDGAAVHCVITGYDKNEATPARLFTYPQSGGEPVPVVAANINGYLLDAPSIFADKRSTVLSPSLPSILKGSQATDAGYLLVEADAFEQVSADPVASKYLRRFVGARELIHSANRWCLWMDSVEFSPAHINTSPLLRERISRVRESRLASKKAATRELASTPHLFAERRQPSVPYVCIPRVVSENREYFSAQYLTSDVIASDAVFTCADEDGFVFSIISSSMFITWQRAVGGRLKSDLRFSNTLVWNNLPLPPVDAALRQQIIDAGQAVLDARALEPEKSLAQHYEPGMLSAELQAAHDALDILVDRAFGAPGPCANNDERLPILFQRYLEMTGE